MTIVGIVGRDKLLAYAGKQWWGEAGGQLVLAHLLDHEGDGPWPYWDVKRAIVEVLDALRDAHRARYSESQKKLYRRYPLLEDARFLMAKKHGYVDAISATPSGRGLRLMLGWPLAGGEYSFPLGKMHEIHLPDGRVREIVNSWIPDGHVEISGWFQAFRAGGKRVHLRPFDAHVYVTDVVDLGTVKVDLRPNRTNDGSLPDLAAVSKAGFMPIGF